MELYLGAVGRDLVVVEFEQFFFCQEYDGLIHQLELGLNLANFLLRRVAMADCPIEEPAEVEIVLLNGVLLHIGIDAEMTDEGLDAVIIEEIEGLLLDYGFQVLLEGIPDLFGSVSPLAGE